MRIGHCVIVKIGHHGVEINHMDLLVATFLLSEGFCESKLENFLEQLLVFLRSDNNIFLVF